MYRYLIISLVALIVLSEAKSRAFAVTTDSVSVSTDSAYELAWPGLLPDNRLFPLKVIRDKIMFYFVLKPVKKIEYYLLLSDKYYYSSLLVFNKGEQSLAEKIALRAENYYTNLVSEYKWAYWYHEDIPEALTVKIQKAALKHDEVLELMLAGTQNKAIFLQVLEFTKRNQQELENLLRSAK